MKRFQTRLDRVLGVLFLVSAVAYLIIFAVCFSELPLNIAPWLQALLLYFHFIPFCLLQLLLCRLARLCWRLLIPLAALVIPGLIWAALCGWMAMGWLLWGFWCIAPVAGCGLAWIIQAVIWLMDRRKTKEDRSAP